MKDINTNEYREIIKNTEGKKIIIFWAPWCGPCKSIAPILEDLATEYQGKVKIVKVDVDTNPQAASRFGIRNIPTLFVFKDGEHVDSVMGLQPKAELAKVLDKHL
mgnify:CR=1 FL=1